MLTYLKGVSWHSPVYLGEISQRNDRKLNPWYVFRDYTQNFTTSESDDYMPDTVDKIPNLYE